MRSAPRFHAALSRSKPGTAARPCTAERASCVRAQAAATVEGVKEQLSNAELIQTTPNVPGGWAKELQDSYEVSLFSVKR